MARGLIARAIDLLWDRSDRIDIVYVCSNADIARQNINRLNVTGQDDFTLSSRITLLPMDVGKMQERPINFVSFTPGTSFDVGNSSGWSRERELMYWMLHDAWGFTFKKATRLLHASAGLEGFQRRVRAFPRETIHPGIAGRFHEQLEIRQDLRSRFDEIGEAMLRAGYSVPDDLHGQRNKLIGELRKLLAQTCLHWLEPDLIILDEFQRFKHLLQGGTIGARCLRTARQETCKRS